MSDNPMSGSSIGATPSVSKTVYAIAGIQTTIYGVEELPKDATDIACLWLLHPRLGNEKSMAEVGCQAVQHWNSTRGAQRTGLLAISFDQRNHGIRTVDPIANESWKKGNKRHAQDMYSIYQGTAQDTSLLITHLASYLPATTPGLKSLRHLVLGVSLGGHSTWHCLLHDKRITAGVVVIGCPDFSRLMANRASKSKLADWTSASPQDSKFFGSPSFPAALVSSINESDPAGMLLPGTAKAPELPPLAAPSGKNELIPPGGSSRPSFVAKMNRTLKNKAVLNLAGKEDKLVPRACSEPFVNFLKIATDKESGWWKQGGLTFVDRVFDGAGHEFTPDMVKAALEFVGDVVSGKVKAGSGTKSRM